MAGNDQQKICLYLIYLPLTDNEGRWQPRERLEYAPDEVARFAGGYTLLPPGEGAWVNGEGQICYDKVLPLWVVAPAGPEALAFFAHLATRLTAVMEQEEIFIHTTPVKMVEALAQEDLWPQPGWPFDYPRSGEVAAETLSNAAHVEGG